ncbi:MAG: DUF3160 domain-containing protein [Candidatus Contendobacter sp.]|nr:DUF3160 domain-containing protein [Candidatus Contendobacter sp.]
MLWPPPCCKSRPWRNLARGGALALLLTAPLLARGGDAPPNFDRFSGVLGAAPETTLSFSALYEENRELAIGDLITVDLLAHAVTRLWQDTLPVHETETIAPRLNATAAALLKALASEPDTPATAANRDFLQLLQALLANKPDGLSERAKAEYQLIQGAAGEAPSPLFGYRMDYSQFLPRAAYAESEDRQRFFRAYRYAATALFPLVPSAALGLDAATGQRLLEQLAQLARLTHAPDQEPAKAVSALQASIADLLPGQPASVDLRFVAGVAAPPNDPLAWGRTLLKKAQQEGRQPQVLSASVDVGKLEPGLTARDALTGYRFAPLLEVADSRVFQRLVYNATGAWQGKEATVKPLGLGVIEGFGPAKVRPLVDEWVAALGVPPLREQLTQHGETAFGNYPSWNDLQKLATGGEGLEGWRVKAFTAYLSGSSPDWPQRAETVKGLWTEFKHAELLYQAQSYTATGKGLEMPATDPAGRGAVIEPAPQAIHALQAFSAELARRAPKPVQPRWAELNQLLQRAATLAGSRKPPSPDEQAFLRGLPKRLDQLAGRPSLPVVVDVHTGVDGRTPDILHAATGFAREAALTVDNKTYRGARYRFFSFGDARRWTDERWRETLADPITSERQAWRLKAAPALVREVVLARASGDQKPQPVAVTLTEAAAGEQLEAWAGERKWPVQRAEAQATVTLPLAQAPELAGQAWVARIAPPPTPTEPLQPAGR